MKQDLSPWPIISETTTKHFTALLFLFRVLFLRFLHHLPIKNKTSLPLAETEIVITVLKYPSVCLKQSFFYIAKRICLKKDKNNTHTIWKQPGLKIAIESKVIPLGRKTFRTRSLLSFPHLWDQIAFLGIVPDSFYVHCKADCRVKHLSRKHLVLKKSIKSG